MPNLIVQTGALNQLGAAQWGHMCVFLSVSHSVCPLSLVHSNQLFWQEAPYLQLMLLTKNPNVPTTDN